VSSSDVGHLHLEEVDRQSLPDKIVQALRRSIVTGALKPGSRLLEADLAGQLGVSRAVLREALRTLQREGLVESRHNRGTFVATVSAEDLMEIYSLRSLLEGYAACRVAQQATAEQVAELQERVDEVLTAAKARNGRWVAEADLRFHKAIWEMVGHKRLLQTLAGLESHLRMILAVHAEVYEFSLDSVGGHEQIMTAIRSGDGSRASELMRLHIESSAQMMRDFLSSAID
jgi:DNA-binding GntR family transcriptional regulator